jgi:hypothetical protein
LINVVSPQEKVPPEGTFFFLPVGERCLGVRVVGVPVVEAAEGSRAIGRDPSPLLDEDDDPG